MRPELRCSPRLARGFALAVGAVGTVSGAVLPGASSLGAAACSSVIAGGGTGDQNPAGPPITIGATVALTGGLAGNSTAMNGALLTAAQQVNALGGILGRQVQVKTIDDASTPSQALTNAQSLVNFGVSALIGPTGSQQVLTVEPFITKSKLVEVSSTATSVQLTGSAAKAGYFFRTVPDDALQAIAVGVFALRGPNADAGGGACHTMDVVHNDDSYGNPLAASLEKYFAANGGTVPATGDFAVPATAQGNYNSQVAQVLKDLPDCLVLAVYPPTAAQFMHNLSDALAGGAPKGWSSSFFVIGTDGTYDPSLITVGRASASDASSQSWVNGTYGPPMYGTVALTNDKNRQQYNDLSALYVAEVGLGAGKTDLDPYTANEYDAVVLTLLAMQAARTTTNGPAIQQAMFDVSRGKTKNANPYGPADLGDAINALKTGGDINYQGASGDVDFDDFGNVVADFLVWEVQGNGFVDHDTISSTLLAGAQ